MTRDKRIAENSMSDIDARFYIWDELRGFAKGLGNPVLTAAVRRAMTHYGALLVERDVAQARVRRLTDVLDELVHAVDHEQSQSWCTTDIDTADARAALAEGEDTRG